MKFDVLQYNPKIFISSIIPKVFSMEKREIAYSDDFGTSAANTPYENSAIINNLVDSGIYYKIIIGSRATDIYLISQPITPDKCDIEYRCILRIMDSITDVLAANILENATSFIATDASKFHKDEFIAVTDDDQIFVYGTYRGWCGKIINITNNVITLDTIAPYNYTAASNGRIATLQSVIFLDQVTYVTIDQSGGYIDGNKAGQAAIHPVYKANNGEIVEGYTQACGISGWKSSYITITDNVIVRNASMHGISFSSDYIGTLNRYLTIGSVHVYDSHEKGLHFKWTSDGILGDVVVDGSTWEDGIIFYSTNSNWIVGSITCTNCGRSGFVWNSACTNLICNSITTSGCVDFGFDCGSRNVTINSIKTSDRIRFTQIFVVGGGVSNVNITNIDIDATIVALITPIVWLQGNIKTITIGKLTLDGCTGIGIKATILAGLYPDDVRVNSGGIYTHTGVKTDIPVGADVILLGDFT